MQKSVRYVLILFSSGLLLNTPFSLGGEQRDGSKVLGKAFTIDQEANENRFVVMTFNTGTTLGLSHDEGPEDGYGSDEAKISDRWYGNGLAWCQAITAVRQMIEQVDPDIVAFQEIFDCQECTKIPVEHRQGFICQNWSPGDANVARMVLGREYQIAYHPEKRSKCLAVHRRFGTLRGCKQGNCEEALEGTPIEGCGSGARVARAIVDRPSGRQITVISLHGTSGRSVKDQQCRVRQIEQIFVDFGDGKPGADGNHNLILGDFNTDPGRISLIDASAARWNNFVGEGKAFHFVSKVGVDSPRAYLGMVDIDHVVSDTFSGSCRYLGVDDKSTPVWEGVYFDHVPVICTLSE